MKFAARQKVAALGIMVALQFATAALSAAQDSAPKAVSRPILDPVSRAGTPLDLTIYHVEGRRSERIVWLCEELGLPYKLEFKSGDIPGSINTIRGINPLMPVAPTVRVDGQVMVESGAIIELILARAGKGQLVPAVDSPDYAYHLQWMHYAEGSLAARIIGDYRVAATQGTGRSGRSNFVSGDDVVKFADDFLSKHAYFGGAAFSAADIMMLTPLTFAESFGVIDMSAYPNVVAWRKRLQERPAYKKMVQVARPNGAPMVLPPLPN